MTQAYVSLIYGPKYMIFHAFMLDLMFFQPQVYVNLNYVPTMYDICDIAK